MTGWRDLVRDQLEVSKAQARKSTTGSPVAVSRVGFAPAVQPFLVAAAKRRGISIAGYIRRATMAFVARDLGLDPIQLFELDLAPAPYGKGGSDAIRDLDGTVFGSWKVHPDVSDPREPDA